MLAACGGGSSSGGRESSTGGTSTGGTSIIVFAAASLTDVFAELETEFEQANPSIDVQLSFAGSPSLREQILEGAPADVFASANESTMQNLVDAGEVAGAEVFAMNELQIAIPMDNPGNVMELADLADESLLVGLCAVEVPCGQLAATVLDQANIAVAADTFEFDVRSVLTKVSSGDLDAGLVYVTDVRADEQVRGIVIPPEVNAASRYWLAPVGEPGTSAEAFIEFVQSDSGQSILARYGFLEP